MRINFLFIMAILLIANLGYAGNQENVKFEDYSVQKIPQVKKAKLKLSGNDLHFKTRLKKAYQDAPNFAGKYILTTWGCGAECIMGGLIETTTGKVFLIPFTLCCWDSLIDVEENFKPIDYRLDSSLIIFHGVRNENGGEAAHFYYNFQNNKFNLLKVESIGKQRSGVKP